MVAFSRSSEAPSSTPSSTPSSPSSPKEVNFAERVVTGISRAPSSEEQWALYLFEIHAGDCHSCRDPYARYKAGKRLCSDGNGLAYAVDKHMYCKDGKVYSRIRESGQKVRIEILAGYDKTSSLLKAIERGSRHKHPFLGAEKPKEQHSPSPRAERAHISPRGHHSPKMERAMPLPVRPRETFPANLDRVVSVPTSHLYTALPVQPLVQPARTYPFPPATKWHYQDPRTFYEPEGSASNRGSLYDIDIARMAERDRREAQMGYKLEVREPPRHLAGHHRSRRHSGFWGF